jgi:hypothetical protein
LTDVVIVALIAAGTSTVAACLGLVNRSKISEVHGLVDGRLTQVVTDLARTTEALRALTEKSSFAQGVKEEKDRSEL